MANEHGSYEGIHHFVGYVSLVISFISVFFTWQTNSREEAEFELIRVSAQREQQRFDREQQAFELEKQRIEREQKAFEREQLAFERERQRFEREQKEYELEQRYAFTMTEQSKEEFRRPFAHCKPVKLVFKNTSKRMTPINVELRTSNLYLHLGEDKPNMKMEDVTNTLKLPAYSIAVDQTCEWQFRIHGVLGDPKEASIQVWVNGFYESLFNYQFDSTAKQYQIAQPAIPLSFR